MRNIIEGNIFNGNLDFRGTDITELPAGLTTPGSLYLMGTNITELPAGMM